MKFTEHRFCLILSPLAGNTREKQGTGIDDSSPVMGIGSPAYNQRAYIFAGQ